MSLEKLDNRSFCQLCGAFLPAGTICPECNKPVFTMTKPKEVLPNCASKISQNGEIIPQHDPKRYKEIMPRECCNCGRCWECTHTEWINGQCPNCGASGVFGVKNEFMENPILALTQMIDETNKNDKIALHLNLNGDSSREI